MTSLVMKPSVERLIEQLTNNKLIAVGDLPSWPIEGKRQIDHDLTLEELKSVIDAICASSSRNCSYSWAISLRHFESTSFASLGRKTSEEFNNMPEYRRIHRCGYRSIRIVGRSVASYTDRELVLGRSIEQIPVPGTLNSSKLPKAY